MCLAFCIVIFQGLYFILTSTSILDILFLCLQLYYAVVCKDPHYCKSAKPKNSGSVVTVASAEAVVPCNSINATFESGFRSIAGRFICWTDSILLETFKIKIGFWCAIK